MRANRLGKGKRLLILGAVLVVIDQVFKVLLKTNMSIGEHLSVFGDWFQILFIENKGMSFGMSFGGGPRKVCLDGVPDRAVRRAGGVDIEAGEAGKWCTDEGRHS